MIDWDHLPRIESVTNPRVRQLALLCERASERRRLGRAVIEGEHLLSAWLSLKGAQVKTVYLRPAYRLPDPLTEALSLIGAECLILSEAVFRRLSSLENSPGPLAVIEPWAPSCPETIEGDAVYLDRLQDPGNAGTILRSAVAFGVRDVFASPGCVDLWSPKVLRAAMGAHPAVRIVQGLAIDALVQRARVPLCATSSHDGTLISKTDLRAPRIWLLGQEGGGLDWSALTTDRMIKVRIDQDPAIESLNVGVAASICLYEQHRQRHDARQR
ncbi:MAG: tRNA/rRNA methyltransferase protein [Pseudomonadota bacterium]|jgi:TrmH family RNA methyltransferase